MQINAKLNLVIPVYRDGDDPYAYVHAMPVGREVFDANFRLLGRTFSAIHDDGFGRAAPTLAMQLLRETAKENGGDADAAIAPFMNEVRRLTNVLAPTAAGWETIPYQSALDTKALDPDDIREVESAIVFFTLGWLMYQRRSRAELLDAGCRILGAQTTSLNVTEYSASLRTSTETVNTGEIPAV